MKNRLIIALVLTISASILCAISARNYMGYCGISDDRLGREEVIDAAIKAAMEHSNSPLAINKHEIGGIDAIPPVKYKNISEFKYQNPGCCSIEKQTSEGRMPGVIERITGQSSYVVNVKYSNRHRLPDGSLHSFPVNSEFFVSNCGIVNK